MIFRFSDCACRLLVTTFYKASTKIGGYGIVLKNRPSGVILQQHQEQEKQAPLFPAVSYCSLADRESQTLVCDIDGALLRTHSFFPYFMLVALEGGGFLRAFLLLVSCPLLWILSKNNCHDAALKVMIFITFCGIRLKDMDRVARAVLPKYYLENLHLLVHEVCACSGVRVVLARVPRIMVQGFLEEYLQADEVIATELQSAGKYFTGLVSHSGLVVKHRALKSFFGDKMPDIGISRASSHDHLFLSLCKEGYIVEEDEDGNGGASSAMTREKYPRPLVFHDGRIAFLPTPIATLSMFAWLPLGFLLAFYRIFFGALIPCSWFPFLGNWSGIKVTFKKDAATALSSSSSSSSGGEERVGVLYVCNHRTLLDPVFLSTSLGKPLTTVTFSVSRMSEILSPIRTVRLTRNRGQDGETMRKLLAEGDLAVCPEGTTCREPYLLRFSHLFAELTDEIVPVAVNTSVGMFHGTTASGFKCMDPIFFLMNPSPSYHIHILEKLPRELTCAGGRSSLEVSSHVQKQLADALGFECTALTRKDKYTLLAGTTGMCSSSAQSSKLKN